MENYFAKMAAIDVKEHIEKKGQFSYLSWAWAVDQLRRTEPDATWEVKRFNEMPYMKTELGYFVEVAVTVKGITLSQIHPVLDGRNRPIQTPNPFDINTSIQRCLVKAIALHGLGLYIYSGEDLPPDENGEVNEPVGTKEEAKAVGEKKLEEAKAKTAYQTAEKISEAQLKLFATKAKNSGYKSPEQVAHLKSELKIMFGVNEPSDIPKSRFNQALSWIQETPAPMETNIGDPGEDLPF